MKNLIWIIIVIVVLCFGIWYFTNHQTSQPSGVASTIEGCYISHLAKDVYTLKVENETNGNFTGKLSFQNFEKDSSSGTYVGTYKDGILLGDYSFRSEGMDSVMQVIFKKTGETFVRGYGDLIATGDRFADINKITWDPNQTFTLTTVCPI